MVVATTTDTRPPSGSGGGGSAPGGGPPEGVGDDDQQQQRPGEASLLVSEFPPPPFYYIYGKQLKPPPIPEDALTRGTQRAAAAAARARAEAERLRLLQSSEGSSADKTDAILGGAAPKEAEEEQEGDVIAVFGEIVEDPLQVVPLDDCQDPTVVRDQVKKLNKQVLQDFVKLVHDLVNRPTENKKTRDELSHNVFLMLQECNKFREHQAREVLIEALEKQLQERQELIKELNAITEKAGELL